ncbi:immunoglobulin-like and fibronectin type III domain-containing protein 1 [Chiloscyllium punctatum]|uniref:immunoglobulin-like and fibronectin type III domain-containing protein 1 n=1 Tax=Chiloscyllium punctatum TaxID=137246 RepID=UPI003B639ABE
MEKKVNQPRNSAKPGVKTRKSSIPGVTIIEFTDDIPQGCSAPDIERRPIPLTMQEGKTANFKAAVRGNPVPTLVWSFKGESLSDGNKYKVSYDRIMNEYVLQIKQLTIDDAGSYKCTVSNEYGEARCAANLNIIEVGYKKKMKKPGEIQGKNTDPTDFRKMLKKRAPPPVKKEQKVPDEKVWEILMHADKKDYERICMEYGLTDFRGMLTKLKQMKKDREEKQTQYVKEISNLKHVETKSDGSASFGFDMELKSPELNIYLYKDGKLIPHSLDKDQKHHLKHVGKRYTFCIKDLHLDDVGLYRVNVEDTEVFATVVDISLIPVDFIHKLQDVKCKEGEDAIFECTISLPLPAEWSYKKIPLENNDKYEIKVSPDGLTQSLIIKNVHHVDKGVYIISAGAGYSSAYLSVGKNLDTASPPSLRKEMESKHSQEDFTDINLEQELNDATKRGLKGRRSSLHDKDLLTKDDLKRKSNYSSEEDSINFGRGGLQSASIDGLDDATKNGQSVYDRMEKDDIGGFNSFGKGGFDGFDGMGRDGKHGLDGIERDGKGGLGGMGRYGKGGLDGMGRDGKGGLDGMGRDGKGGLDGMGRDGKGGLDGMGRDGKSGLDGMGRYGKFGLGGMGRDGKDELEEMGRDRKGGLGGMGRDGKGGLEGMGRDGKDGLDGMGSDGKGGLEGMGRDGKGGLGRMGRDGRGGLGGMGRDGKGGLEGMGRDGKDGLEGMGRDGKGGLGGMGRDGKDGLGGMGRDGRGGLDGMGRDGRGGLDGMGRDGGLDGMGRDGKDGLGGMGRDGRGGLDGMGRDGKGGLGGMGRDGKGGLDGMGRDGKGGLDGMGRDGKSGLDGMGRDGRGGLDGMGRDGGLDGMGRDGKDGLGGMGRDGRGGLDGMGRDGRGGLDGMGRDGKGGLDGMGRDGRAGFDGMGRDGGLDGMGRDGGLDGMGRDGKDGLGGMGRDGRGGLDGMGRDGKGGLDGMGRDGKDELGGMGRHAKDGLGGMRRDGKGGLDGMERDGKGGLDGMERDGKNGLGGMGRDGKDGWVGMGRDGRDGLDGMGRDGKGGLEGMGRDVKDSLGGMGRDGRSGLDRMGRDGKGGLEGMGRDGKDGLDVIGKDSVGRLKGMGRDEMDRMGGMGKDGKGSLDRMGRDGKGTLDGIGRDRMDKMGGMGRDSKRSLDGMGTDVRDGLYGMGRGGKGGLEEMGRDGEGRLYEIGRGGKDSSTGQRRDGKNRMHGTRKDGHDRMYDDGIDNLVNLDGSEKGSWNRSDASGWREMENNLADGFNRGKDDSAGYNNATSPGRGQSGLNDINAFSLPSDLSHRSSRDRSTKGGYALSLTDQKGLLRKDQMSNQTEHMAGGFQDLLISDASQREPSGSSRRRKGNFSESDINETNLDIKNKEPVQRFKSGLLDVSAQKGKAAEFCCVTANENTQGTWFKNGTKITSGNGKIVTKEGAVQKLTIPNVKEEDSGMYTFEADGGKTEASLFVEDPPEFDQDVLDQLGKKDTIIKAGHTATVKVPFSGKPPIKVSWYKDGEELFEDNRVSIDNSKSFTRLSISKCNRKDSGKMTIKLKNESGTTSADVNLAVIDKPQAPQGPLEILASLENCISFKWKPPRDDGGKPIQHYVIERQQVGRNTWTKVGEVDKSTTTFSYDKVEPEKKYKFKIWAVNSEGKSEALLSDVITAGRKDVPGAPAKPNILSASSKSITVSWTPPQNTGGSRIIGYIIEKRKKGSNIWSAVTDTPVTGKKWTITDVIEGLEYEFRVIAVNSSGPGEPSCETEAAFAREPMKVPGTVRDLRVTDSTYSTISLAWTPPIYKGSDIPKGYIVEMKSSGNAAWTRCNSAAVGLNSYTVKGLKKMGMYFLRVRAVSDGGMGEPMELDNYVLAMPPPVHPKFILDESVKSFMIIKEGNSLRVQMPFEASPPPEVIWLKDGFPVSEQATITSTSGSTQLIIPASQRSHSGIYSVTLKNLLGQESFSFEIRVTAVPKPPGPVTLTENVPNSVTISWEPSSDEPLDDHLHYVVMQRDSRRLKWHTVRENIFNNKFTVINIVPGCKYYFRVLAKNDMGYSEPSDTREPWCILRQRDPFALKLPIYKARSNMTAPEFIVRLKTHIAPSGSDINMSCAVKGFPPPKVIWFKDNINIMDDANFWSTNIYGVCSLCIFGASPKQTGEYMAIAENSVGRAITSTRLLVTE